MGTDEVMQKTLALAVSQLSNYKIACTLGSSKQINHSPAATIKVQPSIQAQKQKER